MTVALTTQPSEHAVRVVDRVAHRRGRILGVTTAVIGLAAVVLFGRAVGDATFILNPRGEDTLPDLVVPSGSTAAALGIAAVALGVLGATVLPPKRASLVLAGGLVLFVAAMLVWATANGTTTIVGLLAGSVRRASPLALGALAGVLCERAGVVNIAIEGQLLAGAFAGAVVASAADSLYAGAVGGIAVGVVLGLLLAVLSIRYTVDQIVAATVINILALGLTSFLGAKVLGENPDLNNPGTFRPIDVPLLGDIPVLGPVLFDNTFHVYATFALVAVVTFALYRTRWGLRVRAVGEHPSAADTVGIDVIRLRYVAVLLGGAVAGFGGTFFSLDSAGRFEENMTAGRGFIALAALIFGRWHPVGALGAALVFGFAEEFQSRLATLGSPIPSEFLLMAPYLVTLVVVAGLIGRARPPAADGIPFKR
jgi:general nucleoside transport system permease protein